MMTMLKKLRPVLLTFIILALVASGTPITESFAKWGRRSSVTNRKKHKRYRRHSRAWWRRYRARQRARRERALLRRIQRQQQAALTAQNSSTGTASITRPVNDSGANSALAVSAPRLPFNLELPHTWGGARKNQKGEVTFAVQTSDGRAAGTAVLAPVAVSDAGDGAPTTTRVRNIGGATIAALRRTVIDRMVAEGGWVVNDKVREINGRRVLVVTAQTGTPGAPSKSWTFYFTEVDGRVYSLATTAPVEFAAPVATGSEQVMASLRSIGNSKLASQ